MTRIDGRLFDQLRTATITPNFVQSADGSALIEVGRTRVLCNATLQSEVPRWMKGRGTGWITAEYSMLPQCSHERIERERKSVSGRTQEIQRLVGRSLRSVADMAALGERSLIVDCDVLEADGGTRTASVVGGFVALCLALQKIKARDGIQGRVLKDWVTAVSVGIVAGEPLLDLCYVEDSKADVDMNVVCAGLGNLTEVQGTGEHRTFNRTELGLLLDLAEKGCRELQALQRSIVGNDLP